MGAASYFEDILKRRDEALSQLSLAGCKGQINEGNLHNIVQSLKRIVEQEYAKLLSMMDIATSPEVNITAENNRLKAANAALEGSRDIANKEIAVLKAKLISAQQNIETLRSRTRRLDQELHELKQRKFPASRRG